MFPGITLCLRDDLSPCGPCWTFILQSDRDNDSDLRIYSRRTAAGEGRPA